MTLLLPEVASGPPMLGSLPVDSVQCMDAIELMSKLPDACVDMILADLPYGITACAWDSVIPFEPLWVGFKRVIKSRGAIVLTASQPFTSALVMSNPGWFRYEWIWRKQQPSNFLDANRKPLKSHENVLVFGDGLPPYDPQGIKPVNVKNGRKHKSARGVYGAVGNPDYVQTLGNYPRSVIEFDREANTVHSTQKPVALFSYLIRTYTQPGDVVLDPVCGSGTTAIAARNCNRRFIVGDSSEEYVEIARKRLAQPFTRDMFDHGLPDSEAV